jgi:hypothetical protein
MARGHPDWGEEPQAACSQLKSFRVVNRARQLLHGPQGGVMTRALLVLTFLPGCLGRVASDNGTGTTDGGAAGPEPPPGVEFKFQCTDPSTRGQAESVVRRFTKPELVNTLTALLGTEIVQDVAVQTQLHTLPDDVVANAVTDIPQSLTAARATAMLELATSASELSFVSATTRDRIYGACSGAAMVPDSCAQGFISSFGQLVYRRPLSAAESASLMASYQSAPGQEGLKRVLMQLLLSPALAFHLEVGGAVQGNRVRLTDFEIASRISYRIANTMPDDALLKAAAAGQLQDLATVRAHARRLLLSSPTATAKVQDFFRFYLQLDATSVPLTAAAQLDGIDAAGLKAEMAQETRDFLYHLLWTKQAPFKELLTSRDVFAKSARMAQILETTQSDGMTPTQTTAAHAGILLRPAFLAGADTQTKPMHRGAVIRRRILCDTLGAPDPKAIANRLGELGDLSNLGNRERLTMITSPAACQGCHGLINPVGFLLEEYDQLGVVRQSESVFDSMTGAVTKTFPIDTATSDPRLESGAPTSLANAPDLVAALAAGNQARSCFAETVFDYMHWRVTDTTDSCTLREIESASTDQGTLIDAFVASVANEDIFWKGTGN